MRAELYQSALSIEDATADKAECKAVFVGVAGDYDLNVKDRDGGTSWILFKGLLAGTIYPVRAIGARDADDSAPEAGDILFLY